MPIESYQKRIKRIKEENATMKLLTNMVADFTRRKQEYAQKAKQALELGDEAGYQTQVALLKNMIFQLQSTQDMLTNFQAARDMAAMGELNVRFTHSMNRIMKNISKNSRQVDFKQSKNIFLKGTKDHSAASQGLKDLLQENGRAFSSTVQSVSDVRDEDVRFALESEIKRDRNSANDLLDQLEAQFGPKAQETVSPHVGQTPMLEGAGGSTPPPSMPTPAAAPVPPVTPEPAEQSAEQPVEQPAEDVAPAEEAETTEEMDETGSIFDYKGGEYVFPPLDLLGAGENADEIREENERDVQEAIEVLENKLAELGVRVKAENYIIGAAFSRIELKLDSDVALSKLLSREDDLSMALARRVRLIYPLEGKDLVGVEIENMRRETLRLREFLEEEVSKQGWLSDEVRPITVGLGFDLERQPEYKKLDGLPHLLVGGATGSGKSCFLNALLMGLFYRYTPAEVRLILVDFKRVEFFNYQDLPYIVNGKVIEEVDEGMDMLKALCDEMERRYQLCVDARVRNIDEYNAMQPKNKRIPSIIMAIDEYADVLNSSRTKQFESLILRLAQKSRASGIHLIISTQRPSVKVINGIIKANFPSRVAFQVASHIDSQNILEQSGAHKLLGKGDMLFNAYGKTLRLQAPFVTTEEMRVVTDYIRQENP